MTSLQEWLRAAGLDQYSDTFSANGIDLDIVARLNDADLRELGLNLGDRKRFFSAVSSIKETSSPSAEDFHAVPVDAERRQLTVLFCDLVGYTELTSRLDPEVLQGIVRAYEDTCAAAITRYEGYVFQRLGDGIVAFFGYPLAHEGEAERAIRAGLDIIEALSELEVPEAGRLQVRIGIATGMVVVTSTEKGAVGETMNLAARLQAVAPVNTVVVSERVRQLAGGSFDYEDLGEKTLKGIAQPTHAYRVTGVSEATSRFEAAHGQSLTPLVGRELELGLLMDRWARAQEKEGQLVLLSGEPGIGKSRILNTLRERLEAGGAKCLRFQCSPYYVNSALWPSIANFERALKFARDEASESKLDKLESLIVGHYKRPLTDVRFIASMLSIPCDKRYGTISMTPQKFKDETLRTLVDLTEAAARMRATVVLYEDAHWADPTSLEVLELLFDRVKDIPLLIVLTHRPEFQNRWTQYGHVSALNLSKLTRTQSRAIVSGLTGGKALPDELVEQILGKTDGVPLFVEELTKSILESGELADRGNRYEYTGAAHEVTIPATLRDSLMARLDRYAPVKEIAQIGAAIGREFGYELIAAVAPMGQDQLDSALNQLTDSGLAFRRGTAPQATYTFKHALVQDAAYDSLLKSKRQALHEKIAKQIEAHFPETTVTEPEVLAHHYTEARLGKQASAYWLSAGRASYARSALTEAIRQLAVGIDQVKTLPEGEQRDRIELDTQLCLGNTLVQAKGLASPEADVAFKRAYDLSGVLSQSNELAPILWGIFVVRLLAGQPKPAFEIAKELVSKTQGDREAELVARTALMDAHFWMGDFEIAQAYCEEALALYNEVSDPKLIASYAFDMKITNLIYASHFQWMLGYPDRARRTKELVDAWARCLDNPFMSAFAHTWGAGVFVYCHDLDKHRPQVENGQELSRQIGFPHFEGQAQFWLGWNHTQTGNPSDENLAMFDRGTSLYADAGSSLLLPYLRAVFAEALSRRGEISASLSSINWALERINQSGEASHSAEIHRIHGDILLRADSGNSALAEKAYLDALDIARRQKAKSWELRASTSLVKLWKQQAKRKQAHDLLKPVYDWFTEGFDTKDLKEAKALLEDLEVIA